ncbi:hypothetical protein HS1genome_1917 [Sulfodiicoccus acidiphilus]|uniref:Uncharacterized protein n=1 Tax=Sulfodiicoccus acidiphilus TaxID=1670455 RepID=A0A348B5S6_9CREN|nr:hypothetical protein HS1genome_1917 [Sulfodiicoccus acidiphilus]GGT92515.1 hypothetical protein GCM10007116_07830 [Sulfodiicoccus acidiphilus]
MGNKRDNIKMFQIPVDRKPFLGGRDLDLPLYTPNSTQIYIDPKWEFPVHHLGETEVKWALPHTVKGF